MTKEIVTKADPNSNPIPAHLCEVCRINPVTAVASGAMGGTSFGYCVECLQKDAEPVFVFESVWNENDGKFIPTGYTKAKTFVDGQYLTWNEWVAKYHAPTTKRPAPRTGNGEAMTSDTVKREPSPFGKSSTPASQQAMELGEKMTGQGQPRRVAREVYAAVISYERNQVQGSPTINLNVTIDNHTERVIIGQGDKDGHNVLRSIGIWWELLNPQEIMKTPAFEVKLRETKTAFGMGWKLVDQRSDVRYWGNFDTENRKFWDAVNPLLVSKGFKPMNLHEVVVNVLREPLHAFVSANAAIDAVKQALAQLPDVEREMDKEWKELATANDEARKAEGVPTAEQLKTNLEKVAEDQANDKPAKKVAKNDWIEDKAKRGAYFQVVGALCKEFLGIADQKEAEAYSKAAHKVESHYDITLDQPASIKVVTLQIMRDMYQKALNRKMSLADFLRAIGWKDYDTAMANSLSDKEMLSLIRADIEKEKSVRSQMTKIDGSPAFDAQASVSPDENNSPVVDQATRARTYDAANNTPEKPNVSDNKAASNASQVSQVKERKTEASVTKSANPFKKATKKNSKLRLAIGGVPGGGKTYTALQIATELFPAGKIAVLDTESGSAEKYADLFEFDVLSLDNDYSPENYIANIQAAEDNGYDILIIDSLSHEWTGPRGILDTVDELKGKYLTKDGREDTRAVWRDMSPRHAALITTILQSKIHIIATMRCKWKNVTARDENKRPITVKVIGDLEQRDKIQFEFDIVALCDEHQTMTIDKSRCPELTGYKGNRAGVEVARRIAKWLNIEQRQSTMQNAG